MIRMNSIAHQQSCQCNLSYVYRITQRALHFPEYLACARFIELKLNSTYRRFAVIKLLPRSRSTGSLSCIDPLKLVGYFGGSPPPYRYKVERCRCSQETDIDELVRMLSEYMCITENFLLCPFCRLTGPSSQTLDGGVPTFTGLPQLAVKKKTHEIVSRYNIIIAPTNLDVL